MQDGQLEPSPVSQHHCRTKHKLCLADPEKKDRPQRKESARHRCPKRWSLSCGCTPSDIHVGYTAATYAIAQRLLNVFLETLHLPGLIRDLDVWLLMFDRNVMKKDKEPRNVVGPPSLLSL